MKTNLILALFTILAMAGCGKATDLAPTATTAPTNKTQYTYATPEQFDAMGLTDDPGTLSSKGTTSTGRGAFLGPYGAGGIYCVYGRLWAVTTRGKCPTRMKDNAWHCVPPRFQGGC